MESSAEEYMRHPVIMDVLKTEKMVIDKYMKNLDQNDMVLDLACGTGFTTDYVATKYACSAVGVDLMPDMVDHARAHYGSNKVQFFVGDMCDQKVVDHKRGLGLFTWVMCHYGFHVVQDTVGVLETALVALRPSGHLLINAITRQFGDLLSNIAVHRAIEDTKWQDYRQKLEAATDVPVFVKTPPEGHWIRDTDVLVRLVETHGFSIVHKEISLETFTTPVNKDLIRSVYGCVKKLPEERQDEFLDDVVRHVREISGLPDPVQKINTLIIVAKRK